MARDPGSRRDARHLLARAAVVVQGACGVRVPDSNGRFARRAVAAAAARLAVSEEELLAQAEANRGAAVSALVECFVVHETSFFRHPAQFAALKVAASRLVGPEIAIWCAGCSTGEEAYSVAAALQEAGSTRKVSVWATDVSAGAIEVARAGAYPVEAVAGLDPLRRGRMFDERDGSMARVRPDLRGSIRFEQHNLLAGTAPRGAFDVVFCRNVLIYFDAAVARVVVNRLLESLRATGVLIVASSDLPIVAQLGVELTDLGGVPVVRAPKPGWRPTGDRSGGEGRGEGAVLAAPRARRDVRLAAPARPAAQAPLAAALEAARRGDASTALKLVRLETEGEAPSAAAYLLEATVLDALGDLGGALAAVQRALYLAPESAEAHATLVPLLTRLGRPRDAARSRATALRLLETLDPEQTLEGLERITVGALRRALARSHGSGKQA